MPRHYKKEAAIARAKEIAKKNHGERDTSYHVEFGVNGEAVFINPEYDFEEIASPTIVGTDSVASSSWFGGFWVNP